MRTTLLSMGLILVMSGCAGPGAYSSRYLTMRDGEKIAVDVHLPDHLKPGQKVPVILRMTRYFRSIQLRWPFRVFLGGKPFDHTGGLYKDTRQKFLEAGYAWLDIDVRGSGASTGSRLCPWSPDEIKDGREIVDWIIEQPWSNGRVGAMGISYEGSTAEFLVVNRHPAVRAVVPRFSMFDGYTDVAYPGGIHANWFTRRWGKHNRALDNNAPHRIAGWWAWLFVNGVTPVQSDEDDLVREQAIRDHQKNYDVHKEALGLTFRDDVSPADPYMRGLFPRDQLAGQPQVQGSIDIFSPHAYIEDLSQSNTAIYSYSGWLDGAYPHSAIKRFMNVRTIGSRLLLGPWNHGGGWNINQQAGPKESPFDHDAELLAFFDHHLKDVPNRLSTWKPVRYYTMVEERWKRADSWPPASETLTYYLSGGGTLSPARPAVTQGADAYQVDYSVGTGESSRFKTQIAIDAAVEYPDRAEVDKRLLTYTSKALEKDTEVTGHPLVHLYMSSSATDGNLIVYLEDVAPDGKVSYVTEGHLRLIHRQLSQESPPYKMAVPYRSFLRKDQKPLVPGEVATLVFDLLPTSWLFRKGHSIRLAIAGADRDLFAPTPPDGPENPPTLSFYRTGLCASRIELPRIPRRTSTSR